MIRYLSMDVLETETELIAHQVNCKGVMGAGLARQIKKQYPAVYEAYRRACNSVDVSSDLLGKIQIKQGIVNLFAQDGYGRDKRYTDYKALETCLQKLAGYMTEKNIHTLALPYGMGCGLGGGDWSIVYQIIKNVFDDVNVEVYLCRI